MDCVIPTDDRPERLACTLATLMLQDLDHRRLYIVDNSRHEVCEHPQVRKVIQAMRLSGWKVHHLPDPSTTISGVKRRALSCGDHPMLMLLDNDVLFTRPDTAAALARVLEDYDVAVASPVAYDVDNDRPVLTPYVDAYDRYPADERGVLEGTVALGLCLAMRRSDVQAVLHYWCDDLPYMEDQVLVHFLKERRGYAYLRDHTVLHVGYADAPGYDFDDEAVVSYLEARHAADPAFGPLLELRRLLRDGADFPKPLRRCHAS